MSMQHCNEKKKTKKNNNKKQDKHYNLQKHESHPIFKNCVGRQTLKIKL